VDTPAGARPFPLWHLVPRSLAAILPKVTWSRERLHRLGLPVVAVPLEQLRWQLDLPWWRHDAHYFAVSPNGVRAEPRTYATQWRRTVAADLAFPIHLLDGERQIVLDGLHRLLKADVLGMEHVQAHVVDPELFGEHLVER
jgi:hypothetical protein